MVPGGDCHFHAAELKWPAHSPRAQCQYERTEILDILVPESVAFSAQLSLTIQCLVPQARFTKNLSQPTATLQQG